MDAKTVREAALTSGDAPTRRPGLVAFFAGNRPFWAVLGVPEGASIELGRGDAHGVLLDDERLSRRHARIERRAAAWSVEDLASTNGTFVDGVRVSGERVFAHPRIVRLGGTIFFFTDDVERYDARPTVDDGVVVGPVLREAYGAIERAARTGATAFLSGPSGAGKELAAKVFHANGPAPRGPFVAVNCATIPATIAERVLFGAKKGAYSGADADSEGYVQAADGGTLFLDEIAELDLGVQAKLLRVLETREVLALGATKPRTVDVRFCCATRHDLRERTADGRFREDLYFRVARPEVRIPPIVERLEEIPLHVLSEIEATGAEVRVEGSFIEACCLRAWPGNVRELRSEARRAAAAAKAAKKTHLAATDLDASAGVAFARPAKKENEPEAPDDEIAAALRRENGNVSRAAASLGVHRNRVRRWLEKHGVDARSFGGGGDKPA